MTASRIGDRCLIALIACALAGAAAPVAAWQLKPQARLHLDYAGHDEDARALHDGGIVRRATIGLKGKFAEDWSFDVARELADEGRIRPADGEWKDVALTWSGSSLGEWSVGQFKIPFSLDELTSSNDTIFIERALPVDAFAPSRRIGFGLSHERRNWTLSAMAFGSAIDGGARGRGVAARVTATPVHAGDTVVHLGAALAIDRPRGRFDFDAAPESRVADVKLVDTGRIRHARRVRRLGLEGALRRGAATVQAEWLQAAVARPAGEPDVRFSGWYLAGSWLLTGELRPYRHGRFRRVEPHRAAGAWELAARFSSVDLDDGAVRGGRQRDVTVGLNYHFDEHLRVMFDHVRVRSERRARADAPNLWMLRLQLTW